MRAVLCHAWGPVEGLQLGEVPLPIPADGEVLIAVRAAGINYADAIMIAGHYQTKPPLPFSPGLEAAGIVAVCGDGVTRFRPGDRVMAILAHGGLAELAAAPEAETFAIPDRMHLEPCRAPLAGPARAWRDAAGAGSRGRRGAHRRRDRQGHGRARDRRGQHGGEARGGTRARGG